MQNPLRLQCKTISERPTVLRTRQFFTLLTSTWLRATMACTFSACQLPKVVRCWCVLCILTWKRASRCNGVHFFILISTSKSGLRPSVFYTFDLEMCFAPQRRALFRHLNCKKWSAPLVFCAFWLGNVLRATTACNFSSLVWPDASAPAALARLLLTLRSHKSLEKHSELRLSYLFAHLHLLSSHSFSSLISLFFSSSLTVPTSAFPSVHIVGSLTSKLPSISYIMLYTPIITYLIIPFRKKRRKGPSGFPSRDSCQADSPSDRRRTAGRPVRWWPVAASLRSRRTRRPAGAPSPGVPVGPVGGFTTNKWEEVPSRSK